MSQHALIWFRNLPNWPGEWAVRIWKSLWTPFRRSTIREPDKADTFSQPGQVPTTLCAKCNQRFVPCDPSTKDTSDVCPSCCNRRGDQVIDLDHLSRQHSERSLVLGRHELPVSSTEYDTEHVLMLESEVSQRGVDQQILCLDSVQARVFLNFADWILVAWTRDGGLNEDDTRWARFSAELRRLIASVMEKHQCMPDSLFLENSSFYLDKTSDGQVIRQGFGVYADVYSGMLSSDRVAIKAFRPFEDTQPQGPGEPESAVVQTLLRETVFHRYLRHRYLSTPLGAVRSPFPGSSLCIVSPWAKNGPVMGYLRTQKLDSNGIIQVLAQVADGLSYIHRNGTVHGDLHPGNILIDENGDARLADFGITRFVESLPASISLTRMGALRWMAPEVLSADQDGTPTVHTQESDVFSFAMCSLQICSGAPPFADVRPGRAKHKVISGELPPRPDNMDEALWTLIQDCWRRDPMDRPNAERLVQRLRHMSR